MPPVTSSSTRSVRRTVVDTPVIPAASVTGPMRSAVARADSGSVTDSPNAVWPGRNPEQVGAQLVELGQQVRPGSTPRSRRQRPSRRSRWRCRARSTSCATVARATRRPTCATGRRAATDWRRSAHSRRHLDLGAIVPGRIVPDSGTIPPRSSTTRPSRSVTRRGARAAISRSWVISTIVRPWAWRSTRRSTMASPVRLSRLPVGSSARTIAGSPSSALAMATRWRSPPDSAPGRCPARSARPTAASASRARAVAPAPGHPGVEQPAGDVLQRGQALDEVELLEHEADPPPAERGEPSVAEAADVVAVDAHGPRGRSLQGADDVDQRRLPGPGRADDDDELAAANGEVDRRRAPRSAGGRGSA